jgi:hypothetical protein
VSKDQFYTAMSKLRVDCDEKESFSLFAYFRNMQVNQELDRNRKEQRDEDDELASQRLHLKQDFLECDFFRDQLAEETPGLESESTLLQSILEELLMRHNEEPVPLRDTTVPFAVPND